MNKEITKEYSNGMVTVVWKPSLCIHAANCAKGLPKVFKPKEKPWIDVSEATTTELINQIKQCPSGALSHYINNSKQSTMDSEVKAAVMENGPLVVSGTITVTDKNGVSEEKNNVTAFCRCGASSNKPYCDGGHSKINFVG